MWRGSIHSLSRFTVSPLPAPSTPPMTISTGNFFIVPRSNCALSRASRSLGSSRLYSSLLTLCSRSADSNMMPPRCVALSLSVPKPSAFLKSVPAPRQALDPARLARGDPAPHDTDHTRVHAPAGPQLGDHGCTHRGIVDQAERVLQVGERIDVAPDLFTRVEHREKL